MKAFDFNALVIEILSENTMSRKELASKIGYSEQYLSNLLNNVRRWNDDLINKVCEVFGISIEFKKSEVKAGSCGANNISKINHQHRNGRESSPRSC